MSSGSAQLLVELIPSKPHIIGPRKARSEAPDQDAVEAEADDPLDIAGQARMVERAIGRKRRDRDVEYAAQSGMTLRNISHDPCAFEC
jgi:hypothetical protein